MAEPLVQVARYVDGIDAGAHVCRWLEDLGRRWGSARPPPSVESYDLRIPDKPTAIPNGRVTAVWDGCRQVGLATVLRDDLNFSVVTIVEHANA